MMMKTIIYGIILHTVYTCVPRIHFELPPPVIHWECLEKPCANGYGCTPRGCVRLHSAPILKATDLNDPSSDNKTLIFENRDQVSSINSQIATKVVECCMNEDLQRTCLPFCGFTNFKTNSVMSMLMGGGEGCGKKELSTIHSCLSQRLDHTQCCQKANIPSNCLPICSPESLQPGKLNPSHFLCLNHLEQIKTCFYESLQNQLAAKVTDRSFITDFEALPRTQSKRIRKLLRKYFEDKELRADLDLIQNTKSSP